jgi:hypothetical protein
MVSAEATSGLSEPEPSAWAAMQGWSVRLHVFYRIALLLPLLSLALAAALKSGTTLPEAMLAYGGRLTSVYPSFLIRSLVAYGFVIVWLYQQLHRRSLRVFESLLWQAPLVYVAITAVLLGALVLAHGQAAEFVNGHTRWIGFRLSVHLAIGYGYVALLVWARSILQQDGYFPTDNRR